VCLADGVDGSNRRQRGHLLTKVDGGGKKKLTQKAIFFSPRKMSENAWGWT